MAFDLTPTAAQHDLARRTHEFAEQVIRPVAPEYDQRQEFPVNAVVDPELGHRGQALFVVPGGTPGLEMVRKLDKLGCRASHTAELTFDGVRVPGDHLLGGEEKLEHKLARAREVVAGGQKSGSATLGTFEHTRPMVAAQALGIARAALEYITAYANRREAFGGPIIDHQGIGFPLAELATQIDAARLLTWRASWMAATGVPFNRGEGSMCKLAASEDAVKATERAIQTMGGWGYITDHPVEKWYRDAKLYTIFEGTSEIQHLVIAHALGAADGAPPLHVDLEPSGGPLNRWFGRGTPLRSRVSAAALSARDRVPRPIMRLAMQALRPPRS
jgi:acyl-CoA dehydrogenase